MSKFDFYLNRQGVRGPQGIQGEQGFSPIITVATNTLSEYVLQIQTQNNTFLTANLREHKDDLGGTYIRYNRETGVMFAGDADVASESQMGVVRFATATDIEREDDSSVVSPADVADMIAAIDPSGDITNLQNRVTTLEGETDSLEGSVSANSLAISELQSNVSGLLANYVPKTRTINGYALSSNITLTANDINAYSKSETDSLLADKADVSDLPDMNNYYNTTQIDLMLNDKADISDIPTVGNGTITFTQGGVIKGTITTNQSGDSTIALDAGGGGQYILPPATTSTLGGVMVDGTTITVDSNGVITSIGGGGGGTTYNPGNGIDINGSTNTISAKPDGTTIDFNTNGELKVISAPTPNNMVTTDGTQSISGAKTFGATSTFNAGIQTPYIKNQTGTSICLYISNSNLKDNSSNGLLDKDNNPYLTSANVGTYALTSLPIATTSALGGVIPDGTTITVDANGTIHGASTYVLPTASTSTLGGVKVDGTTITIDNNGVISSAGGGGSSYTAGTGIDITNDVISVDSTVATQTDLEEKQDAFESVAPLNLTQAVNVGKAYLANTTTEFTGSIFSQQLSLLKSGSTSVGNIAELDDPTSAVFEFKNIKINSLSANTILEIKPARARSGIIRISSNGSQLVAYQNLNNSSTQNLAGGVGDSLDFRIRYDKSSQSTYIDYKLSSASSYTTAISISYAAWGTGSGVQYITVGSANTTIDIADITLTANSTKIFERVNSQLSLSIGTGLAVQNGSLVNTVDISNKVTGTGITNMVKLTEAQYEALATKDATTFYVIVAASS